MGAVVKIIDGQLVLDDPEAMGVISAIEKHNCGLLASANFERITYFKGRMAVRKDSPDDVAIVIISADDINGKEIAEVLMPGADWQQYRDKGEKPLARGLVDRRFIQKTLKLFDLAAAEKLEALKGIAVVIIDYGVAEIFTTTDN